MFQPDILSPWLPLAIIAEHNTPPHLLRITDPSETVKKLIMRSFTKLPNQTNPDWMKTVFITPDLTTNCKEQEANRALMQKLVKLYSTGCNDRIKNGQIVRRENC